MSATIRIDHVEKPGGRLVLPSANTAGRYQCRRRANGTEVPHIEPHDSSTTTT